MVAHMKISLLSYPLNHNVHLSTFLLICLYIYNQPSRWCCLQWSNDIPVQQWCITLYKTPPRWYTLACSNNEQLKNDIKKDSKKDIKNDVKNNTFYGDNDSGIYGDNGISVPTPSQSALFLLPDIQSASVIIRLCDITDMFLEVAPSQSFRIYTGKVDIVASTVLLSLNLTTIPTFHLNSRCCEGYVDGSIVWMGG